jgi:LysM repeat protein
MRPRFTYAVIALTIAGCTACADMVHQVRPGECLESISARYGLAVGVLEQANGISRHQVLQIGRKLTIPANTSPDVHKVVKGENDLVIARKHGITVEALHAANPSVRWTRLQIGHTLRLPAAEAPKATRQFVLLDLPELQPPPHLKPAIVPKLTYVVRESDNDWAIANKLVVRLQDLHELNPGVVFARLQPGQVLRILPPGHRLPEHVLELPELMKPIEVAPLNSRWAVLDADRVGVRTKPTTASPRVTLVDKGTPAKVVARSGDWYRLEFRRGTTGWVRGDLLVPLDEPGWSTSPRRSGGRSRSAHRTPSYDSRYLATTGNDIVDYASQFRGTRYRWAGESPRGFDCSGFTRYVYAKTQGISLPHSASAQASKGRAVPKSEIKPGDLVFFKSSRGGSRIGHAGIAIGGGKFIHASSGGGRVQVDSYESGHYSSRYSGARTFRNLKDEAKKTDEADAAPKKEKSEDS